MKVVCVNNSKYGVCDAMKNDWDNVDSLLTLNKAYFVFGVNFGMDGIAGTYTVHGDDGFLLDFCVSRFLSFEEWMLLNRDNKLNELGI